MVSSYRFAGPYLLQHKVTLSTDASLTVVADRPPFAPLREFLVGDVRQPKGVELLKLISYEVAHTSMRLHWTR